MSDTIQVEAREKLGSRNSQKLRAGGSLPAILYGHGEDPVNLSLRVDDLRGVLRHGGKVVDLKGAADGQALLQDLQWDTFGSRLLHVDLMRVKAGEVISLEVEVELKGEAAGSREGGMVEQVVRTVEIEAPPSAIPEHIYLDVTELHLDGSLSAADISDLPEGAKLVTPGDTMIVHCILPVSEPEPEEAVAGDAGEPELVGGKSDDESEESSDE
ncbi:MAG: 50S ribosomal protein L25 [Planctomycetota bacterium]